eukprot:3761193-Pleurochrysis_carterae.AAC.6
MGVCLLAHLPGSRDAAIASRLEGMGCPQESRWRTVCAHYQPSRSASAARSAAQSQAPKLNGEHVIDVSQLVKIENTKEGSRSGGAHPANDHKLLPSLSELSMIHFSSQPNMRYLITKRQVLEAGAEMSLVLEMMQTHSQRLKAIAEGPQFQCGDFLVRVGSLFLNANVSEGTVVEIEYLPCTHAERGTVLLKEFLDLLLSRDPTVADEDDAGNAGTGANEKRQPDGRETSGISAWTPDFVSSTDCFAVDTVLPSDFSFQHSALQFESLVHSLIGVAPPRKAGRHQ